MFTDGTPNASDVTESPNTDVKAPSGAAVASGEKVEKPSELHITQVELDAMLEKARTEVQKAKDKTIGQLTKERDALKSQVQEATSRAEAATTDREEAQKALDEALENNIDPALARKLKRDVEAAVTKEKAALKAEREALAQEKEAHNAEWESQKQDIEESKAEKLALTIFEIAEAVGGDATELMEFSKEFGITDSDKLKWQANKLWPKKTPEPVIGDSGRTLGGGIDLDNMTPRERIEYGLTHSK